jgi:signal transduction protein with GAF and PtsI domain
MDRHDPNAEGKRLEDALSRSLSELAALRARMEPLLSESELSVFDGQRMILTDEEFVGRIRGTITNGYTAERALFRVMEELRASMLAFADSYLRERATDFRDAGDRVLRHLRPKRKAGD